MSAWKTLGAVAPAKMTKVHVQPYQLAQWLARFARGYLQPQPDDSHTSLGWRRDLHIMTTGEAAAESKRIAMALDPRDLVLIILVDGEVVDECAAHGMRDVDVGAWISEKLSVLGFDPAALDAPSPYDVPSSPYSKGERYDSKKDVAALSELSRYFDNASMILGNVVQAHRNIQPGPAPVRLWPHHFDLATIITLEDGDFETARAVGVGLAIPDKLHKEFYFYTYPWPRTERTGLPKLRASCSYQYDGFFGAVQPLSKVVKAKQQEATAQFFFDETIEVFISLLRREMAQG